MSWPDESSRHSLAARGIRTKAIPNPVINPKWTHKEKRLYSGSGLSVDVDNVIELVDDYIKSVNRYSHQDYNDLNLNAESIYLVGSRVSGFHTEESDLDILVVFKKEDRSDNESYNKLIGDYFQEVWRVGIESGGSSIETDEGEIINIDLFWEWKLPDKDLPYLKIWEAS